MRKRSLAILMLLVAPGLGDEPTAAQVELAKQVLAGDDRDSAPDAIATLMQEGSRKSVEAVATFGARTLYVKHSILAGKALVTAGEQVAVRHVKKLLRSYRKFPKRLARVALMAEQIPGRPGFETLVSLAKDKRAIIAATAIRALGARKEEVGRKTLQTLLKSRRRSWPRPRRSRCRNSSRRPRRWNSCSSARRPDAGSVSETPAALR